MRKSKKLLTIMLFSLLALLAPVYALQGSEMAPEIRDPSNPNLRKGTGVPLFELPMPQRESDKTYLGLSGGDHFTIGHIKTQLLIVEVFSFYCPHCQRTAAQVNELYGKLLGNPAMKEKIKMIGIGASNSAYEVEAYRERYQVPFPLFPDEDIEISRLLDVRGTPTFIGIKLNSGKTPERIYFGEGGFEDPEQFLGTIMKLSGWEQEGKK